MGADAAALLAELRRLGFAPIAGASASVRIPVDADWLSTLIAARIPSSGPIRNFALTGASHNEFTIRTQLSRLSFLPAFHTRLSIVRQPSLPASPFLVLRLESGATASIGATLLGLLDKLPPGIDFRKNTLTVDLSILAREYDAVDLFNSLTRLEITTDAGRVIVSADGALLARPGYLQT